MIDRGLRSRLVRAVVALAAAVLALPAAASAATTCDYSSGVLTIGMSDSGDLALLEVASGGEIVVTGVGGQQSCTGVGGPPSVTNVNAVTVSGSGSSGHVVIRHASRFAPGANTVGEDGGDPEIEIFVNLNDQPFSTLDVGTGASGGSVRIGSGGINPNPNSNEVEPDADIFPANVRRLGGFGGDGQDSISAAGGAGTDSPLSVEVTLDGGAGPDQLVGGSGPDHLTGGEGGDVLVGEMGDVLVGEMGDDHLAGMGGRDDLVPGPDSDTMDGGDGLDEASYRSAPSGVSVDLALAGPQSTGGSALDSFARVEDIGGTAFGDELRGGGGPNTFVSREGNDLLVGGDGTDTLIAGEGADSLNIRDGGPDQAFCGGGIDAVTADAPGIETLSDCENLLFPSEEDPPGTSPPDTGPADPATGPADPAPPVTPADTAPPEFLGSARVRPAAFAVGLGRGATFRYRLSEASRVVFTIERRTRLRRVGMRFVRIGAFAQQGNAGRNRKRFSGRIGKRRLSPGSYRATLVAIDAAGNRSAAARVAFKVVRREDHVRRPGRIPGI